MTSFTFDMRHGLADLRKTLSRVERQALPKAVNAGLNKTVVSVRKAASKVMVGRLKLKSRDVKAGLDIKKAGKHRPGKAIIEARGRPVNIIRFMTPAQIRSALNSKKRIVKSKPWGKLRTYRRRVFIGNKGRTAFLREGPSRRDIRGMWGPSIARELIRKEALQAMDNQFDERWPIEIDRALNNELRKLGFR